MEEDIKILEFWKESEIVFPLQNVRKPIFPEREKQALENLLTRYKDLEQIEHSHKKENGELRERVKELEKENQSYRDYLGEPPCYDNARYIPKSKVKEKVEELKEVADEDNKEEYIKIQVLQELLEE